MTTIRTYRLNPPDRTGWLLGLNATQFTVAATGLIVAVAAMATGVPMPAAIALLAIAATVALVRVGGVPLVDAAPSLLRWAALRTRRRARWFAPLPLLSGDAALPPVLDGQTVLALDAATHGMPGRLAPIAVIHDRSAGAVAAVVRVAGGPFALAEPADQDYQVQRWADALAGFCRQDCPVREVRWTEWAAPGGLDAHRAWLDDHAAADGEAAESYEHLLAVAAPLVTRHEVLVTLVVPLGKGRLEPRHDGDRLRAATEALLDETRLFLDRLTIARLTAIGPLAPAELDHVLRVRLDPTAESAMDRTARTLGARAALITVTGAGPLATQSSWTHWLVDGSYHRAFYVAEWPRTDVPAGWLGALLQHSGPARSLTVSYQPITPLASRRAIARQAAKIESDAETRAAKGFRVGAEHHRAHAAVLEREAELVGGFGELAYAGVVTVTAPTVDELDRAAAEITNIAAGAGIELRTLNGRHDLAVAASLPLARGLAPRGLL